MASTDALIGRSLGGYHIQRLLGRGGMARVYLGYDERLQRHAAIKVIEPHLAADDEEAAAEYRERFLREARAIAKLNHPNIVSVYQFGEDGPLYWMAMVFLDGQDLRQTLKAYARRDLLLPAAQVQRVFSDIARALDFAHSMGVIHRDVKPSNIHIVGEGHAVLTDFGLALSVPEGTIGGTFGSAHYIAPEQAVSSAQAVPQSDQYALGVVLYEMLTGRVPFEDQSAMSVALKHLSAPPPPPSSFNPAVSLSVEQVVLRLLSKEPDDRYASCTDASHALLRAYQLGEDEDTHELEASEGLRRAAAIVPPFVPQAPVLEDDWLSPDVGIGRAARPEASITSDALLNDWTQASVGRIAGDVSLARVPSRSPAARWRWMTLLLGASLVLGGGLWAWQNAGRAPVALPPTVPVTLAATPTALAVALVSASPGATTPPPPATDVPSATPTRADAALVTTPPATQTVTTPPAASLEPTATPVPASATGVTASASAPAPVVLADADSVTVVLRYTPTSLLLLNEGEATANVSALIFTRAQGTPRQFAAFRWEGGSRSTAALPAGDCFQAWGLQVSLLAVPDDCGARHRWLQLPTPNQFWVVGGQLAPFTVNLDGAPLAECPAPPVGTTEAQCRFRVPRTRPR